MAIRCPPYCGEIYQELSFIKKNQHLKELLMLENTRQDDKSRRRMLTVNEVAHLLHVHPNTIRLWGKTGALKSYRIGERRDYRFSPDDVETFLEKNANKG
jgi:excisionase family DNA binding protein